MPKLPNKINKIDTLATLPNNIFMYDPLFKILRPANQFFESEAGHYCNVIKIQILNTTAEEQLIFQLSKIQIQELIEKVDWVFEKAVDKIQHTLKNCKGLTTEGTKLLNRLLLAALCQKIHSGLSSVLFISFTKFSRQKIKCLYFSSETNSLEKWII